MAVAAARADLADEGEDDILDRHAGGKSAVEHHAHALLLLLPQRLRREDAFAFTGADAEGQRPEGAMGAGMAVAADERRARQGEAEFWADDMHDAMAAVVHRDIGNAEALGIALEPGDLAGRQPVRQRTVAMARRNGMVGHGNMGIRPPDRAVLRHEPGKGLRARHLLHEMAVDIDEVAAVLIGFDDMLPPDLVV